MKRGPVEASAIHHQPVSGEMTFPRFMKRGPVEAPGGAPELSSFGIFPRFMKRGPVEACAAVGGIERGVIFPRFMKRGPVEAANIPAATDLSRGISALHEARPR